MQKKRRNPILLRINYFVTEADLNVKIKLIFSFSFFFIFKTFAGVLVMVASSCPTIISTDYIFLINSKNTSSLGRHHQILTSVYSIFPRFLKFMDIRSRTWEEAMANIISQSIPFNFIYHSSWPLTTTPHLNLKELLGRSKTDVYKGA